MHNSVLGLLTGALGRMPEKALPDRHQGTACTAQIRKPTLTHSRAMYAPRPLNREPIL